MLNEQTLEERLHEDLGRIQPGHLSVDALIGRGKAIKARRRAGLAAGLAVVAGLAVGAPVVLSGGGGSSAVSAAGHSKLLASGTVGGKRWSFVLSDHGPDGCSDAVMASWGNTSAESCLSAFPVTTDPVTLGGGASEGAATLASAELRPDVDHVTVTATDGTVLTPTVTQVSGRRYAFFALAPHQGVSRLDAVGADGKTIAYALPYNGPDNMPSGLIQLWYPGGTTPTQKPVKQVLLSDTSYSSTPVTVTVDMGPFGVCYLLSIPLGMTGGNSYGPDCHSLTPPDPTALDLRHYPIEQQVLLVAEVNSAVDHVDVMPSDGHTRRLTPIPIGGHSFVAALLAPGVTVDGARAYDASGNQLAKTP